MLKKTISILSLIALTCLLAACEPKPIKETEKTSPTKPNPIQPTHQPGQPTLADTPSWGQYLAYHTQGIVSARERIVIKFLSPVVEANKVGQSAAAFLTTHPAIEGSATFVSPKEIVLVPASSLPAGQRYRATLTTGQLLGFPPQLGQFDFEFSVIKQAFEIFLDGIQADANGDSVSLSGRITTADFVDRMSVEKMLTGHFLNQPVKIHWQHASNGKRHDFVIPALARNQQTEALMLRWNGDTIGVLDQGERTIEIPAIGEFKVAGIRAVQGDRQHIEISFTEKLAHSQNLRGMIQLDPGGFSLRREGNLLKVTPDRLMQGETTITLDQGIKNHKGFKLGESVTRKLMFLSEKPQVRFVGKGVILPHNDRLTVPFEAVNVDSVQVTAFQVYANNIGQFLQENNLDQNYGTQRVGRHLWRKTISLESPVQDNWNRYSLDVSELTQQNPGALFRLSLSINRSNSTYACSETENKLPAVKEQPFRDNDAEYYNETSNWDYSENYYNSSQIKWNERSNPCKDAYYYYGDNTTSERNFLASNIGLIAKKGSDKQLVFATTDLASGEPLAKVTIDIYNFQNQKIASGQSDSQGLLALKLDAPPFYAHASRENESGYLKLSPGRALPTSHFDVGGVTVKQGIKGQLYGERGVWRPGDDIFLTFVLQDKANQLPPGHPVTLEFFNPRGQLIASQTNNQPVDHFYTFKLKTADNALTGNWRAVARLGGLSFHKTIKVEAVIPNRLKVELRTPAEFLSSQKMPVQTELFAQWLHGATASHLKADVAVRLVARKTQFKQFGDFNFDDPAREFRSDKQEVFKGQLDGEGKAIFETRIKPKNAAPGMLSASFTSRVFEESGAFSSERQTMLFHPYNNYLGIKLPKGDSKRNMLLTDTKHKIELASVNADGEKISLKEVEISLYKINWKWWWDKSGESLAKYASAYSTDAIETRVVSTNQGSGEWEFEIKYPAWGRYLVRVCDRAGGHCTGAIFYIDWPGWAGRATDQKGLGASVIHLSTDQQRYQVGDTARINLPPAKQGKALISIENGSRVLQHFWFDMDGKKSQLELPLTADMSPNVYVSLMLLQPHQGKDNDLPIRLFGVVPVIVDDPQTQLAPQLTVAEELAPQSIADIKVAESKGKAMTYTLAIVDEGLLGLTRYRTPDLHQYFYQKEALGVNTWDLFDEVVGAYGGELEKILALGGDSSEAEGEDGGKKKRFPPVVKFLGPFHLAAGETTTHQVAIPQYLGAVRVMLVAGHQGAYGSSSQSVFVRQPLNLLATVPRVVGPEETITIPVAVFVNEQALGDVTISFEHDEHFESLSHEPVALSFAQPGDKLGFIPLKVKSQLGQGRLKFTARNGPFESSQEIFIDIRSANPKTTRQTKMVLEPNQDWQGTVTPHGMPSTNSVTLELSRVPPLNLDARLGYLIRYPHGCVEQVTSSVFPQLYLPGLVNLEKHQTDQIENHIGAAIERLRGYQLASGGFVYWPGRHRVHDWGNNYVGHFLIEAQQKGFHLPAEMLANWLNYQATSADSWTTGDPLIQSYRLYTLALAGQPALGAMNRLRERDNLDNISRWYLAAAYQKVGQLDAAEQLVHGLSTETRRYERAGYSLGSSLRDKAIILDSLVTLNKTDQAAQMAEEISQDLASSRWLSTQSTAYALNAMSHYIYGQQNQSSNDPQAAIFAGLKVADQAIQVVNAEQPIWQQPLDTIQDQPAALAINNQSGGKLYLTIHSEGIPKPGDEAAENNGLEIAVNYFAASGAPIDVARLAQGQEVTVQVKVRNATNRAFQNLALTQIFPSGWEIHNRRMADEAASELSPETVGQSTQTTNFDYQDIRDDRIYTYFDLKENQQKVFQVSVNAAYLGRYYLPAFNVEAMYDASQFAKSAGQWVEVVTTRASAN